MNAPITNEGMSRDIESKRFITKEKFDINPLKKSDLVVSMAGGGTLGIGSLEILNIIDEKLKKRDPNLDLLDILYDPKTIVAGTSTGSILTALFKNNNRINPDTGSKYTIKDLQELYRDISPKIFTPMPRWLVGCFVAPFSRSVLVDMANKYLGAQKVYESPGLVIMAFNKTENTSELIASEGHHSEYNIGDAAEASSAIPCAFSPKVISSIAYSDGGTCIANLHPTVESMRYYKKMRLLNNKFGSDQVVVVDIGAGNACSGTGLCGSGCISSDNQGGLCATFFDGTICECTQHLQQSGPDLVEEMSEEEDFDMRVFKFNFPMQYPLAFTRNCLDNTINAAHDSIINDPEIEKLVDILYQKYSKKENSPIVSVPEDYVVLKKNL
jgi:hypothetical protein